MRPRPWEISSNILRYIYIYNLSFVPLLFHLPTDWTCDPSFVWSRKRIEHYRTVLAEGHQVYVLEIMNRREEAMLNSTMCFAFMKLHLFIWFFLARFTFPKCLLPPRWCWQSAAYLRADLGCSRHHGTVHPNGSEINSSPICEPWCWNMNPIIYPIFMAQFCR